MRPLYPSNQIFVSATGETAARSVATEARGGGKKFRRARDFDVFVLYGAANTKNLNDRDRKKAAEGEHAWTVGPAVAWLDGPVCRPGIGM